MWQKIGRIVILLLCLVGIGGFVYLDNIEELNSGEMELSFYVGDEIIRAWEGEDAYYLFLPSYADMNDVCLTSYVSSFEVLSTGERVDKKDSLSAFAINERYACKFISTDDEFVFCIMKSENLPTVFMETDSGTVEHIWADKTVEEKGKLRLFSSDGKFLYGGGLNSVKTRGNTSFAHYEKKPFSITLKEEVSLLGLGMGQKYVILSNASDLTLVRNDIARRLEAALDVEYDNIGRFIDLYVNGNYFGNYYLCENIEIDEERINITDLEEQMDLIYNKGNYESFDTYENEYVHAKYMDDVPTDITGGYLLEREYESRYNSEYEVNPSGFITNEKEHFVVKSPMYCSSKQIEYLRNYMNEVEEAVLSTEGICKINGKSYKEYIDVDSFVKKYLVEEISKNFDAGVSSMFFYKDSDREDARLKAAPVWDSDLTFGCCLEWMDYFSMDPNGITKLSLNSNSSPWYEALYQKEEYYQKVQEYYADKAVPFLDELVESGLETYEKILSASAAMNETRWKNDFENNPYYDGRETEFAELKDYISQRKAFLDKVWIQEEVYYIVIFEKDENIRAIQYIREGETVEELPVLNDDDFEGWQYNGEKIIEDTVIICK